ncbi:TerD family protein [Dawidia soli]|uniref:TerD family protein n=1 Tax=Dawidia soli TaxID=2782352 RepID=A0AAP2D8G3_9BACT|nr:TerD family protein [Dawidia soli]MBT1685980.1 TerD family protein [Dawidia soli]
MNHEIYIARKRKVFLPPGNASQPDQYVQSLLENIGSLGFTFSKPLAGRVATLSLEDLETFYNALLPALKTLVGAHVVYTPMYPNFPRQVMEASQAEICTNAWLHYLGDRINMRILPEYEKEERAPLQGAPPPRIIDLGTLEDFESIFTDLAGAKVSTSNTDKHTLLWFVNHYQNDIERLVPEAMPHKENMAFVGALLLLYTTIADRLLARHVKTATDVLRIVAAYFNGDVSLAEKTKYYKLSRPRRKTLLRLLEQSTCSLDDMVKYREPWKRLGEKLHPSEYAGQFPRSAQAFDVLRNDNHYRTFYSKVELAVKQHDIAAATALLATRPGELARRLDHLLRNAADTHAVIHAFDATADRVSTPVLLQLLTHFEHRLTPNGLRVFFPKGEVSKAFALPYNLPALRPETCREVVNSCRKHLVDRFRTLPPLGKVFLDEALRNFTVPFTLRSASKALRTVSRGSKLPLPQGNILRFFIWWRESTSRADIDLSAVAITGDHQLVDELAYYNLATLGGYHSGDITSAPNGASEFIDIDIHTLREKNARYIIMCLNSYTAQPFCDLPECFAGVMVRQEPDSGEVYEPRTVENKVDITANARGCIPMILDLVDGTILWTDLSLTRMPSYGGNNAANNMPAMMVLTRAMTSLVKTSLYDLFSLHIEARGERVLEKEKADTIFAADAGITPFDTQVIAAKFL